MPRDALTFGDLIGKLDHLEIVCPKCGRQGRYLVHKLATKTRSVISVIAELLF